jgi:hypothetical protein
MRVIRPRDWDRRTEADFPVLIQFKFRIPDEAETGQAFIRLWSFDFTRRVSDFLNRCAIRSAH